MTDDIPDRTCGVEGCQRRAVARLFGGAVSDAEAGPRCLPCLRYDLNI